VKKKEIFLFYFSFGPSSLNICIVSKLLEAHKNNESGLNDSEYIVALRFIPRRNSNKRFPCGTEKTRMTVPFSDAVANLVPCQSKAMAANGLS
jgi:hypothetical protein